MIQSYHLLLLNSEIIKAKFIEIVFLSSKEVDNKNENTSTYHTETKRLISTY
jgi:hypothetical protein